MKSQFVAIFVVLLFASVQCQSKCRFYLSARNLPNKDPLNFPSDPYAKVYMANSENEPFGFISETRKLQDNNNPNWPELFEFDYFGDSDRKQIKIDVMDRDFDSDDYIGYVLFNFKDYCSASNGKLELDIFPANSGRLTIYNQL